MLCNDVYPFKTCFSFLLVAASFPKWKNGNKSPLRNTAHTVTVLMPKCVLRIHSTVLTALPWSERHPPDLKACDLSLATTQHQMHQHQSPRCDCMHDGLFGILCTNTQGALNIPFQSQLGTMWIDAQPMQQYPSCSLWHNIHGRLNPSISCTLHGNMGQTGAGIGCCNGMYVFIFNWRIKSPCFPSSCCPPPLEWSECGPWHGVLFGDGGLGVRSTLIPLLWSLDTVPLCSCHIFMISWSNLGSAKYAMWSDSGPRQNVNSRFC
jgi:hypothetical protein